MKHFFDVGANIGQTFTDYLNLHPEFDGWNVWCFEPSPRHLPGLMEAAKYQSSRYTVHVCAFGVRGFHGVLPFYVKDDPRGDSFEAYLASDHETNNVNDGYFLYVPAEGIATAILDVTKDGDEVTLKLDCEGSEYDILSSLIYNQAALSRVNRILVEWHRIIGSLHTSEYLSDAFGKAGKPLEQWVL